MLATVWKVQRRTVPGFLGGGGACGAFTAGFTPLGFAGGGGAGGVFLQVRSPTTWSLSASVSNLSIAFGDLSGQEGPASTTTLEAYELTYWKVG